jgi:ABC-type dipeptide/oligopeptide/nickel transport system permease component
MIAYIVRRLLYAIPILIGVNLLTFALFFFVNSPDDMARVHLGGKRVTPEAIVKWKEDRGYNKPRFYNAAGDGGAKFTDTIFFKHSLRLFALEFGRSDNGRNIGYDIRQRMWPSQLSRHRGRGAVCRHDVRLHAVLRHRRAIPGQHVAAPGAGLGLRHWRGCG